MQACSLEPHVYLLALVCMRLHAGTYSGCLRRTTVWVWGGTFAETAP